MRYLTLSNKVFFWSVSTFGGTNNNMNLLMQRSETGAEPLNTIGIR